MSSPDTNIINSAITPNTSNISKKRKRIAETVEELEVDVNAPEPPSKKALRKIKKGKPPTPPSKPQVAPLLPNPIKDDEETAAPEPQREEKPTQQAAATSNRSGHGVWIGNLSFTTTKADLRTFLVDKTNLAESMITRLHMPAPTDASTSRQKTKPQNKGFAYVDFSNPGAVAEALCLSETLLSGRKVLVKDAHDFEGRPVKTDNDDASQQTPTRGTKGVPTRKIFMGNLPFDTDKAELEEHFSPCGDVLEVHIATFEDSGKCKGYAWVTFSETAAAEAAVRGWVTQQPQDSEDDDDIASEDRGNTEVESKSRTGKPKKKLPKPRKKWVNSFKGRLLRTEFAEDATVRYKKRFGKDGGAAVRGDATGEEAVPEAPTVAMGTEKPARPTKKFDARKVKPGAALAAAPRLTGGIVASQGKKITFE
ncbi:MAG: hypothetical protein Q9219_006997 [cf. Caloplaca sp. 3 TL-2023]